VWTLKWLLPLLLFKLLVVSGIIFQTTKHE